MILEIHPQNPDPRKIKQVIECLQDGGVIIYPTDTVYSFGCDILNTKAIERVAHLKHLRVDKANFSIGRQMVDHVLHPGKVCVAGRRKSVLPADVRL